MGIDFMGLAHIENERHIRETNMHRKPKIGTEIRNTKYGMIGVVTYDPAFSKYTCRVAYPGGVARWFISDCEPVDEHQQHVERYKDSWDAEKQKRGEEIMERANKICASEPTAIGQNTAATEAQKRKEIPLATGCLDYFPDALQAVAVLSRVGNEQHNPGTPLHWDRGKSGDESDALARHFVQRGTLDTDGVRHSAKVAWRALALLQKEIEGEKK